MNTPYSSLAKVELHLHLDCSLSYSVVKKLRPETSIEDYNQSFIAPPKCTDLADMISRAVKGVELMQSEKALRWVTLDLFDQLKADKVIYAEIRFAPLLHVEKGLSPHRVVEIVNLAVEEGIKKTGVEARVILCTLRHFNEQQSLQTVALVQDFKNTYVAGFDIAADEAGFPIDNHISAFQFARKHGIFCTAHAGEARGPESVWETLEQFRPHRIGHGVRSAEDESLLDHLRKHKIHLEICPSSNFQTNVFATFSDHSCDKIFRKGISMSISTDARTITNTTLVQEYEKLHEVFGWRKEHFIHCNLEAIAHAFVDEENKVRLRKKLLQGLQT